MLLLEKFGPRLQWGGFLLGESSDFEQIRNESLKLVDLTTDFVGGLLVATLIAEEQVVQQISPQLAVHAGPEVLESGAPEELTGVISAL